MSEDYSVIKKGIKGVSGNVERGERRDDKDEWKDFFWTPGQVL